MAISWPLFQGATSGPEAFTQSEVGRLELLAFVGLVLVAGPVLLWVLERGLAVVVPSSQRPVHGLIVGALYGLLIWKAVGVPESGLLPIAVIGCVAVIISTAWRRFAYVRSLVGLLSFATPVVLVAFLLTAPSQAVWLPANPPEASDAGNGTPVVMLVLDEFPLALLESSPDRIDSRNFPAFAELARAGDWYSNARSSADVTVNAVPALMTGKQPDRQVPPATRNYPRNLFTVLGAAGYEISADEVITDLCPTTYCPRSGTFKSRLAKTLLNGLEYGSPLPSSIADPIERRLEPSAVILEPPPRDQFEEFLRRVQPGERKLWFEHMMLPHIPWIYLPDGSDYLGPIAPGILPTRVEGDDLWSDEEALVDVSLQQAVLQIGFVDREIGRLIKRLKAIGAWDETLFIVVADHGASFEPGLTRRYLTEENSGWVSPVPLFVKYPRQTRGGPVDAQVESTDVYPTVLEALGLPEDSEQDGTELRAAASSETLDALSTRSGPISLDSQSLRRRFEGAVARRNRALPTGSAWDLGGRPDLLKQRRGSRDLRPVDATFDPPWPVADPIPIQHRLPAQVNGLLPAGVDASVVAIELNGTIVATAKTWRSADGRRFSIVLPPERFRNGTNRVRALVPTH